VFGPHYFSKLRKMGVGIGLNINDGRARYLDHAIREIDFFEVTEVAKKHLGKVSYHELARRAEDKSIFASAKHYTDRGIPAIVHGSCVNPLYPGAADENEHRELAEIVRATRSPWVTEDLGVWMMKERHVYPNFLPMALTEDSLNVAIRNVRNFHELVQTPFNAELPGFSVFLGSIHAFDFMGRLTEATGCSMCLDLGHVLSYQLATGNSATANFHKLPWNSIVEIHISGGFIDLTVDGFCYVDSHGDTDIVSICWDMLDVAIELAPNLRAITYEIFGARNERVVIDRFLRIKNWPAVVAWRTQGQTPASSHKVGEAISSASEERAASVVVSTFDLLHNTKTSLATIARQRPDLLAHYAPLENRRWSRERVERMRALGSSLTIFFPMTTAWLRQRTGKSELDFYDELLIRLPGSDVPLDEKLQAAYHAMVTADGADLFGLHLFENEIWMNERVQDPDHSAVIKTPVDTAEVMKNVRGRVSIKAELHDLLFELVYVGADGFFQRGTVDRADVASAIDV
jgi:uncharacterized protein (UPF0276 family)